MAELTIRISDEVLKMFKLALAITGDDESNVFDGLIKTYAQQALSKSLKDNLTSDPLSKKNDCAFPVDIQQTKSDNMPLSKRSDSIFSMATPQTNRSMVGSKAYSRIKLWATKPNQYNHQIVKAFFECEQNGIADYQAMQKAFISNTKHLIDELPDYKFSSNFDSMTTDGGNSHGYVFDRIGQRVKLADYIKDHVIQFRNYFIEE